MVSILIEKYRFEYTLQNIYPMKNETSRKASKSPEDKIVTEKKVYQWGNNWLGGKKKTRNKKYIIAQKEHNTIK